MRGNFRQEDKIARNDLTFTLDDITMWHIRKTKVNTNEFNINRIYSTARATGLIMGQWYKV